MRYEDISPYMRNAIIAIEDRRFYENSASTCAASAARSCRTCSAARRSQGGSTIAQQFVKNALRAQSDRTVFQKMREAALAYHLTRKWPKSKILTQYLNSIYFGNGAYGVESAARTYFGNQPDHQDCGTRGHPLCVKKLKPEEAALIAGVVANPTAYDPVAHPQAALARRNLVLKDMFDQGLLPRARVPQRPHRGAPGAGRHQAAHGADQGAVLHDLGAPAARRPVRRPQGVRGRAEGPDDARPRAPGRGREGGQQVPGQPSGPVGRASSRSTTRAARCGRWSAGATTPTRPFNLATQGQRQPGSSIKPFILASALKKGYGAGLAVAVAQARLHRPGHQGATRSSSSTTSRASTRARRRSPAA